jgi:small-conductance mechanosensitive channel
MIRQAIRDLYIRFTGDSQHLDIIVRIGIALLIIVLQVVVIRIFIHFMKKLDSKLNATIATKIKPLKIKNLTLLTKEHMAIISSFLVKTIKYIVTAAMLIFSIPLILSLFNGTKNLAGTLFGYILTPIKNIGMSFIRYIPNIFSLVIILLISRYILRLLSFFTKQIATGRLTIKGFYSEWATPTYNILKILIYAFTVAMVFPLLPGSDSQVFQGVSILVGIIFSLGSSSVVGNLVGGIVMTYMRPFQIGDRIKINDITGFVVEKTPLVVRLRTHKNEYVQFPNSQVMNANIINYNVSIREGEAGLILHTDITFGYATPWQTVHKLLLEAADRTSRLEKEPKPFILQKALNDFYCCYELNVYTKQVKSMNGVYSDLHQNIQDVFGEAGLDMTVSYFYDVQNHLQNKAPPANAGMIIKAENT